MINPNEYKRNKSGFTLMEILTVLAIIVILAGLLFPALKTAREQANKQKAKAMIGSLEVAINMYFTDQGIYPATLDVLTVVTNGHGPYMDKKDFDAQNKVFNDPWSRPYSYVKPGVHNTTTFDLSSEGPKANDDSDDITNW